MKISIITVFPELHHQFFSTSIIGKAVEKKVIDLNIVRFSDLVPPKARIDEPTCGAGAGMIIKPELIAHALSQCEQTFGPGFKIFFSPQGKTLNQPMLRGLSETLGISQSKPASNPHNNDKHIILVCPRYEGIDERVIDHYADLVISLGDFVIMGGDLPAQVFLEGFLRLIPGIVGRQESVEHESFSGPFLDHPEYGLPVEWQNRKIPDIVLSGNHGALSQWRKQQAAQKTIFNRFDWFIKSNPSPEDEALAKQFIPPHYLAVMHTQINVKDGNRVGESSIASLDIHDIARSACTYGIKNYFIATPLIDQIRILKTFVDFWHSSAGQKYNMSRYKAVSTIEHAHNFAEIVESITKKEGLKPLIIATSAKQHAHAQHIDYASQSEVFRHQRPVLLVFGTGQGLADEILEQCDYLLIPIKGLTDYNHLSVRAAASIILDRWIGKQTRIYS